MSALLYTLLSAVLLLLAYPNFNVTWLAWVALAPLFHALISVASLRRAWSLGYLHGVLFYAGLLSWLTQLRHYAGSAATLGYIALVAYLACIPALFAVGVAWLYRRAPADDHASPLAHPISRMLLIPSWWVVLEWLRAHLLSGFGWGLLAHTQSAHPLLIQNAALIGAYGVSWVIVLANVAIGQWLRPQSLTRKLQAATLLGLILIGVVGYGWRQLCAPPTGPQLRIAVVQGNIPQDEKWDAAQQTTILARYETLTRAVAVQRPDLIIWPETAVPGFVPIDAPVTQRLQALAREVRLPFLVGAPTTRPNLLDPAMWNSAVLLGADGTPLAQYDKLHLVPFGEFIPFERQLPWLRHAITTGDFDAGHDATVFQLAGGERLSVLICFEDIFPELARQFVNRGARLLVNITNDAWFGATSAPYQHLQASIFRAVECHVPVVRSANTGISGFIDARGRVTQLVTDASHNPLFIAGTATAPVTLGAPAAVTLYQRWGDWWVIVCTILVCAGWIEGLRRRQIVRTR